MVRWRRLGLIKRATLHLQVLSRLDLLKSVGECLPYFFWSIFLAPFWCLEIGLWLEFVSLVCPLEFLFPQRSSWVIKVSFYWLNYERLIVTVQLICYAWVFSERPTRKLELEYLNIVMIISEQTFGCLNWVNTERMPWWLNCQAFTVPLFEFWSNGKLIQYSREKMNALVESFISISNFEPLFLQHFVWIVNVDLNRYSRENYLSCYSHETVWSIDELNRYSYIHCLNYDCWLELIFPFRSMTFIPANFVWFMIVDLNRYSRAMNWFSIPANIWLLTRTVIPERTFELWMMTWTVIPAKLFDLNRYFGANVWILVQYSRDIIDLICYSWANVWIMNVDLNRYSRDIVWLEPLFPCICLNQYYRATVCGKNFQLRVACNGITLLQIYFFSL